MIAGTLKASALVPPDILEGFKKLDTTSVSDALDRLGISGGLLGIRPVVPGTKMCGPAYTVHYIPCGQNKGTAGDFLDDVPAGSVVVIDNGGRLYCTVWGDLMTVTAARNGVSGTLINGVCRDVSGIIEMRYPIFTKGCYMATGKDRVEVDGYNIPVEVSGVQVKPGDIVVGDDSGVLIVPLERAKEVLAIANEIAEKEDLMMSELKKGLTLREARSKVGYHNLQTRK